MQNLNLQKAVTVLQKNGVIVHPTDTCYGLACSIFSQPALKKLYRIKKMPFSKPVIILVSSLAEAKEYGEFNKLADGLVKRYWPGPLTIVMRRKKLLPRFLNPKTETIGIRFPNHDFSQKLIKKLGHPIVTTSANITGEEEPYSVLKISQKLKADLVVKGGLLPQNPPSTIADVSKGRLKILRQGGLKLFHHLPCKIRCT